MVYARHTVSIILQFSVEAERSVINKFEIATDKKGSERQHIQHIQHTQLSLSAVDSQVPEDLHLSKRPHPHNPPHLH